MYGRLEQLDDGRWRLRFVRRLAHSPEKVWRAITEPEHLEHWFPTTIEGDRAQGAPLRFVHRNDEGPPLDGTMLAFEPIWLVELEWGGDVIRLELEQDGDGSVLTLLDTFGERGKAARDGAGWHVCLDKLVAHLDGARAADASTAWRDVHPEYVERFGPEAATIGPPEGYE